MVFQDEGYLGDLNHAFKSMAQEPFSEKIANTLIAPLDPTDIEIKPGKCEKLMSDGVIYLPEIKYRRILMKAFGPGGWALVPNGPTTLVNRTMSREYVLICHGRIVSQSRGEMDLFSEDQAATAAEGCKSNALMRCCKDLGIGSELWDPAFVVEFKKTHCSCVPVIHLSSSARKMLWRRKDRKFSSPYKEAS